MRFHSARCFYKGHKGHKGDEPYWTVRCRLSFANLTGIFPFITGFYFLLHIIFLRVVQKLYFYFVFYPCLFLCLFHTYNGRVTHPTYMYNQNAIGGVPVAGWLLSWLVGWFDDISTFVGYLTANPFLCK